MIFQRTSGLIGAAACAAVLLAGAGGAAGATVVVSNNPAGDLFTNAGGSNTGLAVGTSGWYYNNVRVDGTVGIAGDYPRSGNGSVRFSTQPVAAPGTTNSKADIEFLPNAMPTLTGNFFPTASLGLFKDFVSMSYEWFRDSSSTNSAVQHPALRVLLAVPGLLGFTPGGLVFERAYNGGGAAPTDTWVSDTVTGNTNVWNFGLGLGFAADPLGKGAYGTTLADWQSFLPEGTQVIGISAGVGSGWGFFEGAVDNIAWTIGNQTVSYNFELAGRPPAPIPLPAAGWLLIGGMGILAGLARRRRAV